MCVCVYIYLCVFMCVIGATINPSFLLILFLPCPLCFCLSKRVFHCNCWGPIYYCGFHNRHLKTKREQHWHITAVIATRVPSTCSTTLWRIRQTTDAHKLNNKLNKLVLYFPMLRLIRWALSWLHRSPFQRGLSPTARVRKIRTESLTSKAIRA